MNRHLQASGGDAAGQDVFVAPSRRTRPHTAHTRKSSAYSHLSWACGGFLLGAICWHMVGFWSFIDRILDEAPAGAISIAADRSDTPLVNSAKLEARLQNGGTSSDCVTHIPNDSVAETTVHPCVRPVVAMQGDATTAGLLRLVDKP